MRNFISTTALLLTLGTMTALGQNAPMLKGKDMYDRFAASSEVIMDVQGFTYKYSGDWLRFMKLDNDNAISFSRGTVTHTYDIRRAVLMQEERNFIKVFIR